MLQRVWTGIIVIGGLLASTYALAKGVESWTINREITVANVVGMVTVLLTLMSMCGGAIWWIMRTERNVAVQVNQSRNNALLVSKFNDALNQHIARDEQFYKEFRQEMNDRIDGVTREIKDDFRALVTRIDDAVARNK